MSPFKRRFSTFIIFTVTMLTIGISSALYYFKIEKNEEIQNQLHFRTLNEVSDNLIASFEQMRSIALADQIDSEAKTKNTISYRAASDIARMANEIYNEHESYKKDLDEEKRNLKERIKSLQTQRFKDYGKKEKDCNYPLK